MRADFVPLFQRLRGTAFGDADQVAASNEITDKKTVAGLDLADVVQAHDRGLQRAHVEFAIAGLVPAATPDVVLDEA